MANNPKIQIEGRYGQTEQIALDSNRTSIQAESLWSFQNAVALPSSGIYSDMLLWILTPATILRWLNMGAASALIPPIASTLAAILLLLPVLLGILQVAQLSPKTHGVAVVYRVGLLLAGILLAIL